MAPGAGFGPVGAYDASGFAQVGGVLGALVEPPDGADDVVPGSGVASYWPEPQPASSRTPATSAVSFRRLIGTPPVAATHLARHIPRPAGQRPASASARRAAGRRRRTAASGSALRSCSAAAPSCG